MPNEGLPVSLEALRQPPSGPMAYRSPLPCHFLTAPSLAPGRHPPASGQPGGPRRLMGTDSFPEAGSAGRRDWQVGRRPWCDGWPFPIHSPEAQPFWEAGLRGPPPPTPARVLPFSLRGLPPPQNPGPCPSRCPGHGGGRDASLPQAGEVGDMLPVPPLCLHGHPHPEAVIWESHTYRPRLPGPLPWPPSQDPTAPGHGLCPWC